MTIQTSQVWRHERTGRRIEIRLANGDEKYDDWRYRTIPSDPGTPRRNGLIFGFNLRRHYKLEEAL